jgi:small GTP-binding protein
MIDDESYDLLYKIIIIGDSNVGKSNILSRYTKDQFQGNSKATVGVELGTKFVKVEGVGAKLQIWDTAGQEKYRSLAKIFYQNASAAVLVYDITLKKSFEQLKEYWSKEIKTNSPEDIILAIAANKSDDYINQEIDTQEGKDLAKELDAIFVPTSARLGNGIDTLFKMIAEKFVDPSQNMSESYMNKDEFLEQQKNIKLEEVKKQQKEKEKNKKKKCCSNK